MYGNWLHFEMHINRCRTTLVRRETVKLVLQFYSSAATIPESLLLGTGLPLSNTAKNVLFKQKLHLFVDFKILGLVMINFFHS